MQSNGGTGFPACAAQAKSLRLQKLPFDCELEPISKPVFNYEIFFKLTKS
jgi:hypothetical protein